MLRTVDTLVDDVIGLVTAQIPDVAVVRSENHIRFERNGLPIATLWPFREHATLTFKEGVLPPDVAATLPSKRMLVLKPRAPLDTGRMLAAFESAGRMVSAPTGAL